MPREIRSYFEPRFGYDLSEVRIHTGPTADGVARSIGAEAFTVGNDVAFQQGAYRPDSRRGRELIAHELTHVIQQGGVEPHAVGGESSPVRRSTSNVIHRAAASTSALAALGWCLTGAGTSVLLGQLTEVVDDLIYGPEIGGSRNCQMIIDALLGCVFGVVGGAVASQLTRQLATKTGTQVIDWLRKMITKSGAGFLMGGWGHSLQKALAACETEGKHLKSGQEIIDTLEKRDKLREQSSGSDDTRPTRPSSGHVP